MPFPCSLLGLAFWYNPVLLIHAADPLPFRVLILGKRRYPWQCSMSSSFRTISMGTRLQLNQRMAGLHGLLIAYRFAMLGGLRLSGSAAVTDRTWQDHWAAAMQHGTLQDRAT